MAVLENSYLGTPRGKIGNLVYRRSNGKTIISTFPPTTKISMTPEAVAVRRKFGLLSRLSKTMNRDFLINALWRLSKLPGSSNLIRQMKINYPLSGDGTNISLIKIFPGETCFRGTLISSVLDEDELRIVVQPSGEISIVSEMLFPEISAHGVILLTDNAEQDPLPPLFLPLTSPFVEFQHGVPLEFPVPLIGEEFHMINEYPVRRYTLQLAINNMNGTAAFLSSSISGEF